MTALVIVLFVLALVFSISVEVHIEDTIWIERGTDRPIMVLQYSNEDGVTYRYAEDPFERHMTLWELITKYKFEGE